MINYLEQPRLRELLHHFDTAVLITRSETQPAWGRPMAIAKAEEKGVIWFLTSIESGKVAEIEEFPTVYLSFQSNSTFLFAQGEAKITRDLVKVDELWHDSFKVWFPKGKADPKLTLIRTDILRAEYWDNSGWNKARYIFQALGALATGTELEVTEGEQHGYIHS